jgi:acid stress-induced BolA-like protein IbaG/YrbA
VQSSARKCLAIIAKIEFPQGALLYICEKIMEQAEIINIIKEAIPSAHVQAEGADCSFTVQVISNTFASVGLVKRQQQILALFSPLLTTGVLHALSVKAYTPEEWAAQQTPLTQLS